MLRWLLSPSAGSIRGFPPNFHHETLVGLLQVKLMKTWGPLQDWAPGIFNTQSRPHSASSSLSITVFFLLDPGSSGFGSCFCICLFLQSWGYLFALRSQFSGGLKKELLILVCSALFCCEDEGVVAELFTCQSRTPEVQMSFGYKYSSLQ